ncbi:TetR/AcrR family transcriptional regulator [Streptomyces capitiformicae]|uniref:TetR/AcrR family transcriptional regulator n=1 Tax=Streptomyces capitiformicae TaxID=2014920 RepID=UPI001E5C5FD3|nr:TetR/AcrR family transcriptional regulator [Streptomyces capitiformicae]
MTLIALVYGLATSSAPVLFGQLLQAQRDLARRLAEIEEAREHERTLHAQAVLARERVREQPTAHQLLTELSMFALRTPRLQEALEGHYGEVAAVTTKLVTEAAERTGHQLAQPAETLARFFLAGFDGLSAQHLSLPDEEAELTCLQALVSAVVALAGGRMELVTMPTS